MKEKHKSGCNILIMTFTNLEKYVYSKVLKTTTSIPPPLSPAKSGYFRAEKVTCLRLLFAIESPIHVKPALPL